MKLNKHNNFLKIYKIKNNYTMFSKNGRSYKLYFFEKNLWKCRFNKTNVNILFLKGYTRTSMYRYQRFVLYPFWKKCWNRKLNNTITQIRPFNTYTNRGILLNNKVFYKRDGYISGFV